MFTRLGIVFWWIGAFIIGLEIYSQLFWNGDSIDAIIVGGVGVIFWLVSYVLGTQFWLPTTRQP